MKTFTKLSSMLLIMIIIVSCSKDDNTVILSPPNAEEEILVPLVSSINPTSGPKTTLVTINGENFGEDLIKVKVFFNDVEAEVESVNKTKITTKVPASAYTGLVKVLVDGIELVGPEFNYVFSGHEVSTFAGSTKGYADASGENAQFDNPSNAVMDSKGQLFVADAVNNRIRKITPEGEVSTFAGSTNGYADGQGTDAQFNFPYGIAIDSEDNLYVADTYNHKVRKITPEAVVSTLAGDGFGSEDGPADIAQFTHIFGIAVDSENNVFVSDSDIDRIRKITPDGVVGTFAGLNNGLADGIGLDAQFNRPYGLAIDKDDNIYVADTFNHLIRKITPSGEVTSFSGSSEGFGDGIAEEIKFNAPIDVAVDDDGAVYVVDLNNHAIRKIKVNQEVITIAGKPTSGTTDGPSEDAQFNHPYGVCLGENGELYVADMGNNRIRKIIQN